MDLAESALSSAIGRITIDQASKLFTENVLTNDLLCDIIFSSCSPASILRMERVCRAAHIAAKTYLRSTYNINRHLSRFFEDVLSFRSLQARTATLVSGSSALQFFDRSFYPESDLDIYVHMPRRHEVGRWLLNAGYKFVPSMMQSTDFEDAASETEVDDIYGDIERGICTVFTFRKPGINGGEELKVQLMVAARTPMDIILCFHSTCVMNIISYNKAISLYPRATLEERRALVCQTNGSSPQEALAKYELRGWEILRALPPPWEHTYDRNGPFRVGRRWIEDGDSWVIPLDMIGVDLPPATSPGSVPLKEDPVVFTTWELALTPGFSGKMEFDYLKDDKLFYQYVIEDEDAEDTVRLLVVSRYDLWATSHARVYFDASVLTIGLAVLQNQRDVGLRRLERAGGQWL